MIRREFLAALAIVPASRLLRAEPARVEALVFGQLPPPTRIKRVFAAGPPAAVLVHVLAPGSLLGWPMRLADEARAWLAPDVRNTPFLGRLTGRGSTMPLERLLTLEPDVIIDTGSTDAAHTSTAEDVHSRTRIPVVLIPGRLADSAWQLMETGRILGVPERGEELARAAGALLSVKGAPSTKGRKPRAYLARGADGLETATAGSLNAESLEISGAINVARGPGGVARVSPEQVAAWSPDVIITQEPDFFSRARQEPFWRRLRAVREGRIHLAPRLPFGWLDGPPGINRLVSVPWISSRLNGRSMAPGEIEHVISFHETFYRYAPGRDEFVRLLNGA